MKLASVVLRHKWALILVAMLVLLSITVFSSRTVTKNAPATVLSSTEPAEASEEKIEYYWNGSAQDPKYINLPTIKTAGFIQKTDLDRNNQIAAPENINLAGWFIRSARPGANGLSIIDGHVTGRVNDGIFKRLSSIKEGDKYTVKFGNDSQKTFQVTGKKSVPTDEALNLLFSQDPNIKSQLNLITCDGNYNSETKTYDKRLIVYSKLVK